MIEPVLAVKAVMGSSCEEILSWKCCQFHDQNLEIQLTNAGAAALVVPSYCDFCMPVGGGEEVRDRVDYLLPHGSIRLEPGESCSYYCYMDENKFYKYKSVIFYDDQGHAYLNPLHPGES